MELLVYLPLVERSAERHEPNFALPPARQDNAVKSAVTADAASSILPAFFLCSARYFTPRLLTSRK